MLRPRHITRIDQKMLKLPTSRTASAGAANLCKLCDIQDWQDPDFAELGNQIMHAESGQAEQHRKLWEFTQTVRALELTAVLQPESIGLSIAGGAERILYYLARRAGRIVASDIYGEGAFKEGEAEETFLTSPNKFAPYSYPEERLKPIYMNALKLKFEPDLFDFVICLSSIEHFGGLQKSKAALQEMARVVRPGGTIVITTECALNGRRTDEIFLASEIVDLTNIPGLQLTAPIDWSLSAETCEHLLDMRRDNLSSLPHVNLKLLCSVFTSISLVFTKLPEVLSQEHTGNSVQELRSDLSTFDTYIEQLAERTWKDRSADSRSTGRLNRGIQRLKHKLAVAWYKFQEYLL